MENSKSEILHWINSLLKTNFNKIEQLGNGVAYCRLLNMMDPTCLNPTKIVLKTKTQIDHINNLKLFQTAIQKLHLKKQFDIDKVSKCYFHENYDLALFLKKNYTQRFSAINKENTSINNSIVYENPPIIIEEQSTSNHILLTQIAVIMQSQDQAETKVLHQYTYQFTYYLPSELYIFNQIILSLYYLQINKTQYYINFFLCKNYIFLKYIHKFFVI